MRIDLGYPDRDAERQLLAGEDRRSMIDKASPVFTIKQLFSLQQRVRTITVSDAILDYLQNILDFTRQSHAFEFGLSPRGGLALLNAAKAFALLDGQSFVLPEHVQTILPSVVNHRLPVQLDSDARQLSSAAAHIIESVGIS